MKLNQIVCSLVAIASCVTCVASACDFDDDDGPDIAVVLSGGGALAATQVGGLKVIEEVGVPVHCIVGTSMGAVVGGLYSSGYDASELKEIFETADWPRIVTGKIGHRERSFRAKEQEKNFFSDYFAGRDKNGLTLPSGLQSLRRMRLFLREQTAGVGHVQDFDELPTPYRAIGTDLSDGAGITLGKGDLVEAMLASMAVPAVFPAVKIDGRILVDGGMSKQIGVDVARDMGADIVIVIDTTVVPEKVENVPSFAATAQKLIQITVWQNWKRQIQLLTDDDVHIQPDLEGLSTSAFQSVGIGYDRGYEAAQPFIPRLEEIAEIAAPTTRDQRPEKPEEYLIAAVVVEDEVGVKEQIIKERLQIEPGDRVSDAEIRARLRQVESLGAFDGADYIMSPVAGGETLTIRTRKKSLGSDFLQVGARFSNTFDGNSDYALLMRWSRRPINSLAGEISAAVAIGDDLGLDIEYFQPLGARGRYYVAPTIQYQGLNVPVRLDDLQFNENWIQTYTANLQVGRELGLWGLVSLDGFVVRADSEPLFDTLLLSGGDAEPDVTVTGRPPNLTVDYAGSRLRFAVDTLDSVNFPTKGITFDTSTAYYRELSDNFDDRNLIITNSALAGAMGVGSFGVFGKVEGGAVVGGGNDPSNAFYLGGFKRISGAVDQSVPATRYGLAKLEVFKRLTNADVVTGLPIYLGATIEYADVRFESSFLNFDETIFAGSIYGALETPIGPAYIAYGHAEGGRNAVYFFFGRSF